MKIKRLLLIPLLLLVGCSAEADTKESTEVEATDQITLSESEDFKITDEFRSELNRFTDGVTEYSNKDKVYRDRYKALSPTDDKSKMLAEYKDFLDDFDVYLESYYFTPKNDIESELTNHMRNYIMHMKSRNSHQKKFTQTEDFMYDKLAIEEADETIIAIESLVNAMTKHGLITE